MPGISVSLLSAVMKEFYLGPVVEQLNNEVLILQRLEARDQELVGKAAFVPLHTGRSGGLGARGEYIALPDAGAQVYARAEYALKYLYGVVRVSGPSIELTSSEVGSFVQALRSELDGIRNDLRKDVSRQVYGSGNGVIGTTAVNTGVNVLVLENVGGVGAEAINKGHFYIGQFIDIGTPAAPTSKLNNRDITAVNAATPSVTVSGAAVTTAAGDGVSRAGSRGASVVYEISGLREIVSTATGTVHGLINPTTFPYWDNIRDTAGTAITESRLMQLFNKVRIAGGETSAIISGFGNQRVFWETLTSLRRFNDPMKIEAGFQTLDFMGKPIIADVDCPNGIVFLLDERFIKVFSNRDWHFLDQDNSTLKWDAGYDAWKAVLTRYMNLGATRRNTQAIMTTNDTTGF